MGAVTTADWPAAGQPFTVAEFDRLPNDGRRYELLDGVLVVSPRPTTVHRFAAARLFRMLDGACPEDLCVLPEPAVELDPYSELAPDLVVVHLDDVGGAKFTTPPLLVAEVRSPSTAMIDLGRKKAAYERFGVPSYWVVNPHQAGPEITVFALRDGKYVMVEKTTQPFTVATPFPVSVTPAALVSRLRNSG
jgi:Uma2 family endonuclease